MRAKITNRLLSSLKPRSKPFEVFDTTLRGFVLRVNPSGEMVYYIRYRRADGSQGRLRIGPSGALTPAQARDLAQQHLADVVKGADPADARRIGRAQTLREFLEREYGPWLKANRKSGAYMLTRLMSGCGPLLDKKLAEITPWLVEKWRAEYVRRGRIVSANRHLAYLKSCLARAVEWGQLEENPVGQKVKRLKEDTKAKIRYLTPDEEARLLEALDAREERIRRERESYNTWCRERGYPERATLRYLAFVDHLKPMVLLSLHTGLRRGEVFNLRWDDIDLQRAMLTVSGASAKSGYTRHVPLNETARATLEAWRRQSAGVDLVFPNKDGRPFDNCNTSWESVLKEAGITGFRWHDMRHTFASKLVMAGVDLNTVRELLGHSDIKMTLRYAHLAPQVKAAAVAKLVSNTIPLGGKREEVSIP